MILRSRVDGNGQEYMKMCVGCRLDDRGNCDGKRIVLENNHKKNSYSIYEMRGSYYARELARGKQETLELTEFQKWLSEQGYTEDEHACKEARDRIKKQANEDFWGDHHGKSTT